VDGAICFSGWRTTINSILVRLMPSITVKDVREIDAALRWADRNTTSGLSGGPVVITLGREPRNNDQNAKLWAMLKDFTPIEFNGRKWDAESWKAFILSAFNQEMPAVGLNGEPVSMGLSSSKLSKKRFAELIEFIYATGSDRGVKWSEPALAAYKECAIR
jgi:hypothetical protein